ADVPRLITFNLKPEIDEQGWAHSHPDSIVAGLSIAYHTGRTFCMPGPKPIPTWESAARTVYDAAMAL
ncbi:MAG: hypothetical protein V4772_03630, partial [Pseudomonadota bacterium]